MTYQTLHTPPITPEELYWLETQSESFRGVKTIKQYCYISVAKYTRPHLGYKCPKKELAGKSETVG